MTRALSSFKKVVRGFTIVEFLVCIAIFTVITAVVLYRYSDFNNNLVMTNQAYELSLAIRQTQVYGLSVREFNSQYDAAYGIHFERGSSTFFTYVDVDRDGRYTESGVGGGDQVLELKVLDLGTVVSDICTPSSGAEVCSQSSIDISFVRPNPDARIIAWQQSSNPLSYTKIKITAPNGRSRNIIVRVTGQISVEVVPAP